MHQRNERIERRCPPWSCAPLVRQRRQGLTGLSRTQPDENRPGNPESATWREVPSMISIRFFAGFFGFLWGSFGVKELPCASRR